MNSLIPLSNKNDVNLNFSYPIFQEGKYFVKEINLSILNPGNYYVVGIAAGIESDGNLTLDIQRYKGNPFMYKLSEHF